MTRCLSAVAELLVSQGNAATDFGRDGTISFHNEVVIKIG